jgi:hypothetical protein
MLIEYSEKMLETIAQMDLKKSYWFCIGAKISQEIFVSNLEIFKCFKIISKISQKFE